jgi:hypothetical protein
VQISVWLIYCSLTEVPTIELVGRRYAAQKTVDGEYDIFVLATNPMHPDYGLGKDEIMGACKSRQLMVDT